VTLHIKEKGARRYGDTAPVQAALAVDKSVVADVMHGLGQGSPFPQQCSLAPGNFSMITSSCRAITSDY
jgi:hypothetical protein